MLSRLRPVSTYWRLSLFPLHLSLSKLALVLLGPKLLLSLRTRCRFWRLLVFCGISFLSSLSASCRRCCWRRLVVVVVVGVLVFSEKSYSILGLQCMQPPWSRNTKGRMILLRYWVCGCWISSVCHPKWNSLVPNSSCTYFRIFLASNSKRTFKNSIRIIEFRN